MATPKLEAPPPDRFPTFPAAWYLFGDCRELAAGPMSRTVLGRELVAFRTATGKVALLDARCAHMHANLGKGCVVGETIQCPYHNWRYGIGGRCEHIPSLESSPGFSIPDFARQRSYSAAERHGLLYFFNGPEPLYPLPFFDDCSPDEFIRARPFGMELSCPWWLVGANACDVQHFFGAHDRRLAGTPVVEAGPFVRRARAPFSVVGTSWRDRLTRWFGGGEVELAIADWCGTLMFVTASFRRTRSYGMLASLPIGRDRVWVRGVVFVRRNRGWLGPLVNPVHLRMRRYFIKEFLRFDAELASHGLYYRPGSLLACDQELANYFCWLAMVSEHAGRDLPGWTEGTP